MNIEEARLYLEHTSKDDFNLEEWQKENRYKAIQVILQEIESQKRVINGMIDNEEQYCLDINKLNNKINKLEETLAKIKDLNTMKYLRDDIFKDMLNEILKGSDKNG